MRITHSLRVAITATFWLVWTLGLADVTPGVQAAQTSTSQGRMATAKSMRCTFALNATGNWNKEGRPDAGVKPATLALLFESIDTDDGSAQLRTGSATSEITVRLAGKYLHFMQAFRTGPLYTTTVFDIGSNGGLLMAVHSRHEYFSVPLPGATSSPEQYYGECQIIN